MQKLSSDAKISDYAPTDSEANILPLIRGEVVSESVRPYRPKRHLNDSQKFALGILIFLVVFVGILLVIPWPFKFMLLLGCYLFIAIVSKTDVQMGGGIRTPNVGGGSAKAVPGSAIVPRS